MGFITTVVADTAVWANHYNQLVNQLNQGVGDRIFNDIAALKSLNMTGISHKTYAIVLDQALYRYEASSALTPDNFYIVQPTTGGGRWIMEFGQGQGVKLYSSINEVKGIDTTGITYAMRAEVTRCGQYTFDPSSTLTADDLTVLAPIVGTGRWILAFGHPDLTLSMLDPSVNYMTMNGYRYTMLLQMGTISSSDLNTELATSANLVDFAKLLRNQTNRDLILKYGYSTIYGSSNALAQILTRGHVAHAGRIYFGFHYPTQTQIFVHNDVFSAGVPAACSSLKYSKSYFARFDQTTTTDTYRFGFYTNTFANNSSTISAAVLSSSCVSDSQDAGYFGGGQTGASAWTDSIAAVAFPNDSIISFSATLSDTRRGICGVSGPLVGYFCGGYDSVYKTLIDALTYSTGTTSIPSISLGGSKRDSGRGESATNGYVIGGENSSGAVQIIEKIVFNTPGSETIANSSNSLVTARYGMSTTKYANGTYIYCGNGDSNRLTQLQHSNDAISNINSTMMTFSAGNGNNGFYGGGGI